MLQQSNKVKTRRIVEKCHVYRPVSFSECNLRLAYSESCFTSYYAAARNSQAISYVGSFDMNRFLCFQ